MPVSLAEREKSITLVEVKIIPIAVQIEPVSEPEDNITALFPAERFHDRKLGKLIAALVADQRQNHHINPALITRIATRTTSITESPSRKTGHALSKMIAKLESRANSTDAVNSFINAINPINNVHTLI